jgi:hypothetical protein
MAPLQIILLAINLSTFHFSQGLQIMDFERFKGYREMSGILILRYLGQFKREPRMASRCDRREHHIRLFIFIKGFTNPIFERF